MHDAASALNTNVTGGVIALLVALAAATAIGAVFRHRQGRLRPVQGTRGGRPGGRPAADGVLTRADLGAPLGEHGTLVQFSTAFCARCGPTRRVLGQVAAQLEGVSVVEIDAAARLDLTRRLHVYATPTVLVLGPDGTIVSRTAGQPRKTDLIAAIAGGLPTTWTDNV
ncbi:MAG: thioredoxin family protein [Streptosporangiaceae bacterium]|nr:thioredoxin family protein [Streptosporangiaceae bacterium]MBV9858240.1 thioredoxin family protein [Streptosporangiaceae bacterium]